MNLPSKFVDRSRPCQKCHYLSALNPLLVSGLLLGTLSSAQANVDPFDLRCEYKNQPYAIETSHPRLFWKLSGSGQAQRQTAYQILVASSLEELGHNQGSLWDSGRVDSGNTIQIPYMGKPLSANQQVFWKVRAWDEKGKDSAWSKPAAWTMGLLKPGDWTAKWISPPIDSAAAAMNLNGAQWIWHAADAQTPPAAMRWFQGSLEIPKQASIVSAKLIISADDRYKVTVNGGTKREGPQGRDAWRTFQVHDVTKDVQAGTNTVRIEAENTESGGAGVIAKLVVTTTTGTLNLVTDATWQSAPEATGSYAPVRVVGAFGTAPWGKLTAADGTDRTPPAYFRKSFTPAKRIKRALLYATALGVYELWLNGKRVGTDTLSPGWTDFRKRVHYLGYEVTDQIKAGENVLGAILGDGWYASYLAFTGKHHYYGGDPKLCAQLRLEYADGTSETLGTDATWKVGEGPIRYADMLMGCVTDTRKDMPGWNSARFNDSAWKPSLVQSAPELSVESQPNEPIRPTGLLTARKRTAPQKQVYLYDMGQNMVGWARLKITGAPGQTVTIRYGERLNPNGTLYTTNLRSARATDTFILKGGEQTLEPHFVFHGFQYVEVTGTEKPLDPKNVEGVVVSSDLQSTLSFDSDNPMLNRLVQNIDWGFRGNSLDVPTDCPQRDERAGWTGDAQVFAKTAMFHRNAAPFFTKWIMDLEDGQTSEGAYPDVAPSILGAGNAAWEDAGVVCVYRMYEMYGDTEIIRQHWPSLTRFMEHLATVAPDGIRSAGAYGDWLLLAGPQKSLIHGTAYYYYSAALMSEMAKAIGKSDEAERYRSLTDKIKTVFNDRFVSQEGRVTDEGKESQTFYALALNWELLPPQKRDMAVARLQALLRERGGHLATGFIGTPVLLDALAKSGHANDANRLLLTDTYPSWLYQVKLGSTTMWERWDGWTPEKGFQDAGMNSFNHYWLGCVGEWMYTGVAGINTVGAGWEKIVIHPRVPENLNRANCSYDSIRGRIESRWEKKSDGSLVMQVVIPTNTTATVYVPTINVSYVKANGKLAATAPNVRFLRQENEASLFELGSGKYTFEVAIP